MTQTEFYEAVKTAGPFEITAHGIRQCGTWRCPITAVAHAISGHDYDTEEWDVAARAIELDGDFAHTIVCCADDPVKPFPFYDNDNAYLLEACGVEL